LLPEAVQLLVLLKIEITGLPAIAFGMLIEAGITKLLSKAQISGVDTPLVKGLNPDGQPFSPNEVELLVKPPLPAVETVTTPLPTPPVMR